MSEIIKYLKDNQQAIASCSKRLTSKQMIQATSIAIHQSPALMKCTKETIYEAVLKAARMGLDCSGLHGHGYLVPYGKKCEFVPGWRGLVSIAKRAGGVLDVWAECIYENDVHIYRRGLNPALEHEPTLKGDPGTLIAAYAVATLESGGLTFEVVKRSDIDAIANESRSDAWRNHFNAMAKKTAIRALCSRLPRSLELDDALDLEFAAEDGRLPSEVLRTVDPVQLATNPENTVEEVKKKIRRKRAPKKRPELPTSSVLPSPEEPDTRGMPATAPASLPANSKFFDEDQIPF